MANIANYQRQEQGTMVRNAQRFNIILSSVIGSVASSFLLTPFEVVSTEMQCATMLARPLPSTLAITRLVFQKFGPKVLYMAAVPQLLKHLISAAVFAYILTRKAAIVN